MAFSTVKLLFIVSIVSCICTQVHGLPWFAKAISEPGILFVRYRAASLLNAIRFGIGGLLTYAGQTINSLLTSFGRQVLDFLNSISKLFPTGDLLKDNQLETYKLLTYFKEQYVRTGNFPIGKRSLQHSVPSLKRVRKMLTSV